VDAAVPATESLVGPRRDVLWLKTTVEQVVGDERNQGMLSREFDVILLDPPHAALLGMLFGGLLKTLARLTRWLMVYQGHTSQSGRGRAVFSAVREVAAGRRVAKIVVDSEELVICGPDEWPGAEGALAFEEILALVKAALEQQAHAVRLELSRRDGGSSPAET